MIENSSAPQRHNKTKHGGMTTPGNVARINPMKATTHNPEASSPQYVSETAAPPQKFPLDLFSRPENCKFFEQQANGHGIGYLVGLANFGKDNISSLLDPADIDMFLTLAHYCSTQTRPQREQLAEVLLKTIQSTHRHLEATSISSAATLSSPLKSPGKPTKLPLAKQYAISIPTSMEQIRNRITEGKNSFFANLPHPPVNILGDYAYILPTDCIRDLFAHGQLFRGRANVFPPIVGLADSPRATMLRNGPTYRDSVIDPEYRLAVSVWSDDFEPNYSKLNRGSVWIKTIAFHLPERSYVPITNVYPIAVGPKGQNHHAIESILYQNLQSLSGAVGLGLRVYDGHSNCIRTVSAELITVLQDQPERRRANRLMLGNSTYHSRFGICMDYSQVLHLMPSCSRCEYDMISTKSTSIWTPRQCDICTNWSIDIFHPMLKFRPPENYPDSELPEDKFLHLRELDFGYLKSVVEKAHQKLVSREWSRVVAEQYLRVNCINGNAVKEIVACAENCYSWQKATEENNQEIMRILEEEREREPNQHKMWSWPSIWDFPQFEIWQSTEVPMHVIFKGVVDSTTTLIQRWVQKQRKYESFLKFMSKRMQSIKDLHVSWLKAEPYTRGELGGWVSENYLALARISAWVYSGLMDIANDPEYEEPNKPQARWTRQENEKWLSVRRLDSKGNAATLRERVASFMNSDDGPPSIPPPTGGSIGNVNAVSMRMFEMVSFLMGMDAHDEGGMVSARLIRLYLNSIHRLDTAMRDEPSEAKKPIWLSSYNFLSLLNIPKQVAKLGPLRNRWEGGVMGEGFLRKVKPTLTSPNRLNWTKNLLTTLVRQHSIINLRRKMEKDPTSFDDHWLERDGKFRTYGSLMEIEDCFQNHDPISIVIAEDKESSEMKPRLYAIFREANQRRMLEFTHPERGMSWSNSFGLFYHLLSMGQQPVAFPHGDGGELVIVSYGVLLPRIQIQIGIEENGDGRQYCLIDHRWRVFDDSQNLTFPHLAVVGFDSESSEDISYEDTSADE